MHVPRSENWQSWSQCSLRALGSSGFGLQAWAPPGTRACNSTLVDRGEQSTSILSLSDSAEEGYSRSLFRYLAGKPSKEYPAVLLARPVDRVGGLRGRFRGLATNPAGNFGPESGDCRLTSDTSTAPLSRSLPPNVGAQDNVIPEAQVQLKLQDQTRWGRSQM